MNIVSRKIHGYVDYVIGVLLIIAPYLLGFAHTGPASSSAMVCGVLIIIYSLLTNYEAGVIKIIPFKVHRILDFVIGAALAFSPWYLNYANIVWLPHVLVGTFEMIAPFITRPYAQTVELPSGKHL